MRKVCAFSLRTAREKKCNDRSLQDKEAMVPAIVNTADRQLAMPGINPPTENAPGADV